MKFIKLALTTVFALFFICCSASRQPEKSKIADAVIIEKNKQIAVLNEVSNLMRDAQSVEKLGRNMDAYRLAPDAASRRTCNTVMEDNRRELADLENRIKNLPVNYVEQLTPLLSDLNQCVSCSKNAIESCVKSRAAINKTIKELFP